MQGKRLKSFVLAGIFLFFTEDVESWYSPTVPLMVKVSSKQYHPYLRHRYYRHRCNRLRYHHR